MTGFLALWQKNKDAGISLSIAILTKVGGKILKFHYSSKKNKEIA